MSNRSNSTDDSISSRLGRRDFARPGRWIAVHGCGGVGLSAVQIAAAAGAIVVAVDVSDAKLAKARDEGAAETINARGLSPEQVGQLSEMRLVAAPTFRRRTRHGASRGRWRL